MTTALQSVAEFRRRFLLYWLYDDADGAPVVRLARRIAAREVDRPIGMVGVKTQDRVVVSDFTRTCRRSKR